MIFLKLIIVLNNGEVWIYIEGASGALHVT